MVKKIVADYILFLSIFPDKFEIRLGISYESSARQMIQMIRMKCQVLFYSQILENIVFVVNYVVLEAIKIKFKPSLIFPEK